MNAGRADKLNSITVDRACEENKTRALTIENWEDLIKEKSGNRSLW